MFPVPFHPPFPFALPPLPGSSVPACFGLFPRPPGRVMCGRMSICGCWRRVGLLACHHIHTALSLIARSLFLVVLRFSALSGCGRLLRFLWFIVVVSIAVSSRIRYRMIRCG